MLDFGFGTLVADQQIADFVFKQAPQVLSVCVFVCVLYVCMALGSSAR